MPIAKETPKVKLRVCIADDHQLMLNGPSDALLRSGDIEVLGCATRYAYEHGLVTAASAEHLPAANRA